MHLKGVGTVVKDTVKPIKSVVALSIFTIRLVSFILKESHSFDIGGQKSLLRSIKSNVVRFARRSS
jgi:hypothetical protein|tara:strand:- start:288 stop:485 length:198 start_codon:yes stop_codon:yes gene_type:complete